MQHRDENRIAAVLFKTELKICLPPREVQSLGPIFGSGWAAVE